MGFQKLYLGEKNRLELQNIIHNKTKTRYVFGVTIQATFHFSPFLFLFLSIPSSIPAYLYIFIYFSPRVGTSTAVPLLVLSQLSPLCGSPAPPPFLSSSLLLSSSSHFARVRGARQSVQPSGLKVNAYVIANCLQSLGAALKKRHASPTAASPRLCQPFRSHLL